MPVQPPTANAIAELSNPPGRVRRRELHLRQSFPAQIK
jgi:hypothetical protein